MWPQSLISRRRLLFGVLPSLSAASLLRAWQNTTFSADVKVVNVLATVRDKQGHIVSNLSKDDFVLEEDGRPQMIRYFSRESDLPLTLGLLIDTSLSQRRVLGEERTASYRFLDQVLREEKDQAFVIHFDREVELLQDITSSRKKLEAALQDLQMPQQSQPQGGGRNNPGGPRGRGRGSARGPGTVLYDAVLLASDEVIKKQAGRKALIVLSDGVDTGSKVPITQAIESAHRADSLVYSILFADEDAYRGGYGGFGGYGRRGGMGRRGGGIPTRYPQARPDGKKVLERISRETGGGFFEVSKKQPLDKTYERIQEELRNQYSLGYSSDQPDSVSGFRKISLTVKQKGLVVQARQGYYPKS